MIQNFPCLSGRIPCFLLLCFIGLSVSTSAYATSLKDIPNRYLYVEPGQTLHNLVARLYPDQKARWPEIRREIVQLNPSCFVNGNEAQMKAGVRLNLPKKEKPTHVLHRVGKVTALQGHVVAVDKFKVTRRLAVGDAVYVGDKLVTGGDGYLKLSMIDHAKLNLRCFTIVVIEKYALKTDNRTSILKLLQGSIKRIDGEIGKSRSDIYELQTPVASIGVRGTEYALRVYQSKGCGGTIDTDKGLYLKVIKGLVSVKNKAGSAVVAKGNELYVPLPNSKPVKKKIPPGVLKPVEKPVVKKVEVIKKPEPKNGISWWWYALGIVVAAAVL